MDGSLRGDWDEGPQDSANRRWEVEKGEERGGGGSSNKTNAEKEEGDFEKRAR